MTDEKHVVVYNEGSLLLDSARFAHAQRVAKMLTTSTMVPEHFRNNLGNCIIALNYSDRVGIDPFMAMQKMYVIHGKPAVETQLQIALFNKCGRFSSLKYHLSGKGDKQECYASATELSTKEKIDGPVVSIQLAKDEGWYGKKGSKWKTLPELMLRYRSAAFFIRLYAPDTTLGIYTSEELHDSEMINVTPEKDIKQEIHENANQEKIDIDVEIEVNPEDIEISESKPDQEKKKPVEKKPTEKPKSKEITEEEKQEIIEQEQAEQEQAEQEPDYS